MKWTRIGNSSSLAGRDLRCAVGAPGLEARRRALPDWPLAVSVDDCLARAVEVSSETRTIRDPGGAW